MYYVDSQRNMAVEMDDKDLKGSMKIKKGNKNIPGQEVIYLIILYIISL